MPMNYRLIMLLATGAISACQPLRIPPGAVQGTIDSELQRAAQAPAAPATPKAVSEALLPPLGSIATVPPLITSPPARILFTASPPAPLFVIADDVC